MSGTEIEHLIRLIARLPGLGPRSARRAVLTLLKRRDQLLKPLIDTMIDVASKVKTCSVCGNYDSVDPCTICTDINRNFSIVCVVEDVASLWAMERSRLFRGCYHVLGGVLSALDGVGPNDLTIDSLVVRAESIIVNEVILAMAATVDGQTTAHYLVDRLSECHVSISCLAQGVPIGGELDYLDDGTIGVALRARQPFI
ncbi:MAG: recombination mediator RecR [Rhodospirillaceae bacterium]|jgi:recombination protein RecR|nr:recombination mediator RecR [Rhodospirillaceae bacterium]